MTFYKYTLLNKASQSLIQTYIGQWVDPDLGCWNNDFVGCDTTRSMGIVYNGTASDPDCAAGGATVQGYGNEVPILGIDYFRGPKDTSGVELGMSAFVYYNNDGSPTGNPNNGQEYYGYLSGFWKDGSPIESGGTGYQQGTFPTTYMFPDDPTASGAGVWSECSENNAPADRRFVQSSGPFVLLPGTTNEVIIGAVWVPNVSYPCPSFSKLQQADDKAQGLFDNCFKLTDGPDAPDLCIIEMDQELVITLSNEVTSNNYLEGYSEKSPSIPSGFPDSTYTFQGYLLYQLANPSVQSVDYTDVDQARLVARVDNKDGVTKLINYLQDEDPDINILIPNIMTEGDDSGISHSFNIKDDLFATGDKKLINHKRYYYSAIAYASNNYLPYDPMFPTNGGQQLQYLPGRLNIKAYTGIPHKTDPENGGTIVLAEYGDEPEITRIDGKGHSGGYLRLTEESSTQICENYSADRITYQSGFGPFSVKVFNPLNVVDGTYTLELLDSTLMDTILRDSIYWVLTDANGTQYFSDKTIDNSDEKLIEELGISIRVDSTGGVVDAAEANSGPLTPGNGFVGAAEIYDDADEQWYGSVTDDFLPFGFSNFIRTKNLELEQFRDPEEVYSGVLGGAWYPYPLVSWKPEPSLVPFNAGNFITPIWTNSFSSQVDARNYLSSIRSVDIFLTSDKSKWSRCVVINTFSDYYDKEGLPNPDAAAGAYGVRTDPSVGKDGNPDGTGNGFSWFPGYAIDVETGERLNIFFGENTFYSDKDPNAAQALGLLTDNGHDMIWNPSGSTFEGLNMDPIFTGTLAELPLGGQHTIYVAKERYDECAVIATELGGSPFQKITGWAKIMWTSMPLLPQGYELSSMADGLIKNDVKFELRVQSSLREYNAVSNNVNEDYNKYEFTIEGKAPTTGDSEVAKNALDLIQVVPNPYYAFSAYENGNNETIVKITNLPPKCVITIFSLDGQLIRKYNRNEDGTNLGTTGSKQVYPAIEWDLKNSKQIQVSSGVYIIHVEAEGIGERVIKWFGSLRRFDSVGL